jgi:undecaprenyl-diphosphatase
MDFIINLDKISFIYLNSLHTNWLDPIMALVTRRDTWFPSYIVLIFWLIYIQKKEAAFTIISILLAVLVSDQICSGILKPLVGRLRPCHEPSLQGTIHLVNECGGKFGFCSSHAANSFALATSIFLFYGKNIFTNLLFIWAVIVSYSRIYVGVHYPLDIIFGGIIGATGAYFVFETIKYTRAKFFKRNI